MPLGMEVGLGPGDIVFDEDPAPHGKGHRSPHFSRPMSVVDKQSPISATAELLLRYESGQRNVQTRSSQYFAPLSRQSKKAIVDIINSLR